MSDIKPGRVHLVTTVLRATWEFDADMQLLRNAIDLGVRHPPRARAGAFRAGPLIGGRPVSHHRHLGRGHMLPSMQQEAADKMGAFLRGEA